jgi:hypothetical protein
MALGSPMRRGWRPAHQQSHADVFESKIGDLAGESDQGADSRVRSVVLRSPPGQRAERPCNLATDVRDRPPPRSLGRALDQVFFIGRFGGAELKAGSLGLATAHIRQWVGLGG